MDAQRDGKVNHKQNKSGDTFFFDCDFFNCLSIIMY